MTAAFVPGGRSSAMSLTALSVQLVAGILCRATVRFLYRCEVTYEAPLPPSPVLFASNHRSFLDPPGVSMWLRQPIAYFARASLWKVPPIRLVLNIMQGIPVDRDSPGASSMKGAIDRLKQGVSVLVFPEGTRTRTGRVGKLRDGPALFARRAGVPIVPVYLHRFEAAWPRGALLPRLGGTRIAVRFGAPIQPPANLTSKEADAWVMRRLTAWMQRSEALYYGHAAR